eukprot:m.1650906 g.1650906  ORF g.1650906 m.1650906 type:complete len:50 (-) comp88920_c0_seq1:37-186(-)
MIPRANMIPFVQSFSRVAVVCFVAQSFLCFVPRNQEAWRLVLFDMEQPR